MNKDFTYRGNKTNEISFPLGGIGTGCIGLAGNGRLMDWEIFNRPNKNSYNGFSFFAIRAETQGQVRFAKVLHGDFNAPYSGVGRDNFKSFGFGPPRESLTGMPHFTSTSFKGEYPFAEVSFHEDQSPLDVKLTAFNPLIPLNDKDSSLPAVMLEYTVTNRSGEGMDITVAGNVTNPHKKGAVNQFIYNNSFQGIHMNSEHYQNNEQGYGDLTLSTDHEDVSYQSYWYRGGWFDNLTMFWKEFTTPGKFKERNYNNSRQSEFVYNAQDVCLLASHQHLADGETGTFRFMISWSFPNYVNFWNPGGTGKVLPQWTNYYATLFENSSASATYIWSNWNRLTEESRSFKESLYASSLPDVVIDAVASNISILKSPTCVRLTDGTLYGFEGCHVSEGCCEGSCTHVWNYDQVTPFLFPTLARSMRDVDYKVTQFDNGKMTFRLMLPVERSCVDVSACSGPEKAAADGQMGGILKTYREWKICGDTDWLQSLWPKVKKALEFAWDPSNVDGWDKDADGVMEGVQHHTLDVDIYGPNSYITGYYHAALLAAAEMAEALGDHSSVKYRELLEKGKAWVDANLYNGEYYHQIIDLQDSRFPIDAELNEIKYQIGEGCHIDQVIGQWYAHLSGLGYIFDEIKVKSAIYSVYKYNFMKDFRDYANACRIYAHNDESGLLICTWPKGNSPKVPVPYADECMNGFEYQAACHMIYEGMINEGLTVVKAIRDRYDGERRNPWNEFECGSNYARSMASYSLLIALSGFEYDTTQKHIGFTPRIHEEDFRCFWSLHKGWGNITCNKEHIELEVVYGGLEICSFGSELFDKYEIANIVTESETIAFKQEGHRVSWESPILLQPGAKLTIGINRRS